MTTHCPECGRALTIREAIKNRCGPCLAAARLCPRQVSVTSSFVKANFDVLIAAELKKRDLLSAA